MFQGIVIDKDETGQQARLQTLDDAQLPAGNVTIRVGYSTLNCKDGLAITGKIRWSASSRWCPASIWSAKSKRARTGLSPRRPVVLNGWGVGETHWGGLAQKARVDGDWLVPLPSAFSPQQAMAIGTAGYTAMLCVMALERHGVRPDDGEIVVTGAAGGWAASPPPSLQAGISRGRSDGPPRRCRLPAAARRGGDPRTVAIQRPGKPLGKERWAGAVDVAGSHVLANVCATTRYRGVVTACGLTAGFDFPRRSCRSSCAASRSSGSTASCARAPIAWKRGAGSRPTSTSGSWARSATGRPGRRHSACRGIDQRQGARPRRRRRQRVTPLTITRAALFGRRLAQRVRPRHVIQETS